MTKTQEIKRRGGRPPKIDAGKIESKILDAAAALFFHEGYGTVSIEDIARRAMISKRTFYTRFDNKEALFRAVVQNVIHRLRPPDNATDQMFIGADAEDVLRRIAPFIIHAALQPDAVALLRIVMAEAKRFPELALIMNESSARQEAIRRIAELLQQEAHTKKHALSNPEFLAEQFLQMLTSVPQRRALGLGVPMTKDEIEAWASATVDLFLKGCWG